MKDLNPLAVIDNKPADAPDSDLLSRIQPLGKGILIVDDDPEASWLLGHLLAEGGYDVQTAKSAADAMKVLYSFTPHGVLMDVRLPGMNGLELTRLIKRFTSKDLPVLAVSAGNGDFSIQEAYEAGCDGYFTKPVDNLTFAAAVGQYLGRG
jgi:CheY-like chemotaxis protein